MKLIELGSKCNIQGKAGNLNKLYNRFNIARGFIIPNEEFINFLNINGIFLDDDNDAIVLKIMEGKFPDEDKLLKYFLDNYYDNVIVRSSASLEDGQKYSFAGQFASYTNTTIDNLIINIKKCWISQFNNNIGTYKEKYHIANGYSFDILIQEMVISEVSGIAFSINPIDGTKETLIEVLSGQCEDLVSGKKIPHMIHGDDTSDDLIGKEKLTEIRKSIDRLKEIFHEEIEIEFAFKEDKFYLFQVRPITSIHFSINEYIDKRFWCCFKNNNWTLFNRSLWILGATKYKNKNILNEVTEDITLYYPHNERQLRGFNGNQPPLDNTTISSHKGDDIKRYIEEYNIIIDKINKISTKIDRDIITNDYSMFCKDLKVLIKENAILNSYEYLINSLGNALYNELDKRLIELIENWKNNQNSYFPIYDAIFDYIYKILDIDVSFNLFREYTHVDELIGICHKKLKVKTLVKRIKMREENGFVLLNVQNKKYCNKVITTISTVELVKKKFEQLPDENQDDEDIIKGNSTLKNGSIINGECIVIKDNNMNIKDYNLKDKILVCEITTAKDIDNLKDLKALIVNSGGVLCHSAIFSREFNIPCLMGCINATERIKMNDRISYNVDKEYVEIIR